LRRDERCLVPQGVSFAEKNDGDEVRYRMVDIAPALQQAPRSSANLPISRERATSRV